MRLIGFSILINNKENVRTFNVVEDYLSSVDVLKICSFRLLDMKYIGKQIA